MKPNPRVQSMMTIERNGLEIEVAILGTFIPEEPMVRFYKDGSGHPGSPAEIDDLIATLKDGDEVWLTDEEVDKANALLMEAASEIEEDFPDDEDGPSDHQISLSRAGHEASEARYHQQMTDSGRGRLLP